MDFVRSFEHKWSRTLGSDLDFCLGVLQIMRNHFGIERMTGVPLKPYIYIYHPQPYYDIGQQKTCKSGKNGQCPYCSNNKTARDKRKTNKTKVSPLPSTICCLPFYVKSPHGNNKNKDAPPHRASYNICDPCLDQ